jgi:hypothetical protein
MFKSWNPFKLLKGVRFWCIPRIFKFQRGRFGQVFLLLLFLSSFLFLLVFLINRIVFDQTWLVVRVSVAQRCNILLCRSDTDDQRRYGQSKRHQGTKEKRNQHAKEENTQRQAERTKTSEVLLEQPLQMVA